MSYQIYVCEGAVCRDAEVRVTPSGTEVGKFSVAINGIRKDEKPFFANITCFGKLAQIAQRYIRKGSLVLVEGELRSSEYKGKKYTDVIARSITLCGGKTAGQDTPAPAAPAPAPAMDTFGGQQVAPAQQGDVPEKGEIPF